MGASALLICFIHDSPHGIVESLNHDDVRMEVLKEPRDSDGGRIGASPS